ncbi:unnamed protein product [Heligmosomoides polygyrus]|uniref:DUF5641 domain-containing protein n=1 Tax=Heligmosomoides polygyrus TaxID=6339 RepID=A0A3P8I8B5_HELPZ|nr:unnamed protein product [Heligmosomoides polygyrus]
MPSAPAELVDSASALTSSERDEDAIQRLWSLDALVITDDHDPSVDRELEKPFRRFIARRGTPSIVYSDNSTTFRSAETAIASLIYSPTSWRSISSFCSTQKINWKFITLLSPWKGGFYERLVDHFWELWHSDYLAALRERHQARTKQPRSAALASQPGDVVLIADEKLPRGQWNYDLVVSLLSGKDGVVRAAEVRTASGKCLTRSISHLYPLEIRAATTYAPPQDSLRTLSQDSHQPSSHQDSPSASSPARTQPKRSAKSRHLFIRT